MKVDQIATLLRTFPIFHDLQEQEVRQLAGTAAERVFAAGDMIITPAETEPAMYAMVEGECLAHLEHADLGFEVELKRYYPGDLVGVENVIDQQGAATAVRALTVVRAVVLAKTDMDQLLESCPAFTRAICRSLAAKVQQHNREHEGVRFVRLQSFPNVAAACRLLPRRVSSVCRCLVVDQQSDRLTVAMVNPSDLKARSFIRGALPDYRVELVAITEDDFDANGRRFLGEIIDAEPRRAHFPRILYDDPKDGPRPIGGTSEEDLLSRVLAAAIHNGASDIHFEPYLGQARVRLRIDGRMVSMDEEIVATTYRHLSARIKVLSELDTTKIRRPQYGRFVLVVDDRRVEFRVSLSPCHGGEKIVLRVVAPSRQFGVLSNLILSPTLETLASDLFQHNNGLILVTGPSGAGKTTTLYAALNSIVARDSGISVVTIEDPVEYDLPFATQIQVNRETGMDFATILKSVLRQDPDVILVGEIRDAESAAMAAEAATTGHLVLSSLHTYSALEAIIRLRNLKVEPYLIGAGVKGVIAQQLVPRLVPGCTRIVTPEDYAVQRLTELGVLDGAWQGTLLTGRNDEVGPYNGEKGRVAIYEMLSVTPALRAVIDRSGSLNEMEACLDATCFASFGNYARFLLEEGLVAPDRLVEMLPKGHAQIRGPQFAASTARRNPKDAAAGHGDRTTPTFVKEGDAIAADE